MAESIAPGKRLIRDGKIIANLIIGESDLTAIPDNASLIDASLIEKLMEQTGLDEAGIIAMMGLVDERPETAY